MTSGELGVSPRELEKNLERVLNILKTFHAILLLDEADVFMEKRSSHNVERNALVSIFLRLLEYYQGILILTTDRIKTLDAAFHSRIHIHLGYPDLVESAREQIWRNFGLQTKGTGLLDEDYAKLAKWKLNGRQIKNIFSSSKALATDKGELVSMSHMELVWAVMNSSMVSKLTERRDQPLEVEDSSDNSN